MILRARFALAVLFVLLACFWGCGADDNPDPGTPAEEPAGETPATPGEGSEPAAANGATGEAEVVKAEVVKAEAGVGVKGKSLEGETGIGKMIAQPAISYFKVKQKIVFDVQIPQAVNLFQATEGRKPNSHDEFMEKIVKANNIKLPKLRDDQRYFYDPETAQLMVGPNE